MLNGNTVVDAPLAETSSTDDTQSQEPFQSAWGVAAPLTPDQVPFGQYGIQLSITFQDGNTSAGLRLGDEVLYFENEPGYTVKTSGTVIGYDYPATITITGNLQVTETDGTVVPFAGGEMDLAGPNAASQTVSADASGNFTIQVSPTAGGTLNLTASRRRRSPRDSALCCRPRSPASMCR